MSGENSSRNGWRRALTFVVATRLAGLIVVWAGLWLPTGGEAGVVLTGGLVTGALALVVMLHTRRGRSLLFLGWLLLVLVAGWNIIFVDNSWETVRSMILVLGLGALWFVDWAKVINRLRLGLLPARSTSRSGR